VICSKKHDSPCSLKAAVIFGQAYPQNDKIECKLLQMTLL
jgi:hypothetical protein